MSEKSISLVSEDSLREAGYMLPQSGNAQTAQGAGKKSPFRRIPDKSS